MRLLFVNPVGTLGGAERVLLDALGALRRLRPSWRLSVIAFEAGPLVKLAEATGATVRVVELPGVLRSLGERSLLANPRLFLGDGLRLVVGGSRFVRDFRGAVLDAAPDLVHTNGFKAHFLVAALCGGTPSVLHAHDFLTGRPVSRRWVRRLQRPGLAVVANSKAVATEYAQAMPSTPVHTVYNAVDPVEFHPGAGDRAALAQWAGLPEPATGCVTFGMVGTYGRWKGHLLFLDAAARAVARRPDRALRFYVVGGRQYATVASQASEAELRAKIAALGLQGVAGLVPFQERVAHLLRGLDVLVHPSTEPEPFGKSIAEGMASGLAVIAAAQGGSVELFEDGVSALGFRPRSVVDLADKMLLFADDAELRARLGVAARARAENQFGIERFGNELVSIYEDLVRSATPVAPRFAG